MALASWGVEYSWFLGLKKVHKKEKLSPVVQITGKEIHTNGIKTDNDDGQQPTLRWILYEDSIVNNYPLPTFTSLGSTLNLFHSSPRIERRVCQFLCQSCTNPFVRTDILSIASTFFSRDLLLQVINRSHKSFWSWYIKSNAINGSKNTASSLNTAKNTRFVNPKVIEKAILYYYVHCCTCDWLLKAKYGQTNSKLKPHTKLMPNLKVVFHDVKEKVKDVLDIFNVVGEQKLFDEKIKLLRSINAHEDLIEETLSLQPVYIGNKQMITIESTNNNTDVIELFKYEYICEDTDGSVTLEFLCVGDHVDFHYPQYYSMIMNKQKELEMNK